MAKESGAQKETVERVMHEFKHGELENSRGGKVKSHKQAVAIALNEAGASKYNSSKENKRNLARTKRRERAGQTARSRAHVCPVSLGAIAQGPAINIVSPSKRVRR